MNFTRGTDTSFTESLTQIDWAMPRTTALGRARRSTIAGIKTSLTSLGGHVRRKTPAIETVVLVVWALTPLVVAALVAI